MKYIAIALIFVTKGVTCIAQDTTDKFSWLIFTDVYYSYDFNQPINHEKPFYLYNYKKHNEVTLNLALIKSAYRNERMHANFGFMAGTYPQYNMAAEPLLLRHIYEANVGIKLHSKDQLWLDAGIFPSHLGYESPISKDNWVLTRSLAAENSPYYEAGIKLSYFTKNKKWLLSGLILNGWQRINRIQANNTPAFGTQITATPNEKNLINWSTFTGNEFPDSTRRWRHFNNLYFISNLNNKTGLTFGLDVGIEQANKRSKRWYMWYTPYLMLQYKPNLHWALAMRGEFYNDEKGVIIPTGTTNGFKTFGLSFNVDKKVGNYFLWRTDIRYFKSKDAIFKKTNMVVNDNTAITTSAAFYFNQ